MMYMMYMIYMMYMMLCYFVPLYIQNRGRIMISILKCGEENQSQLSIKNQKKRKKKNPQWHVMHQLPINTIGAITEINDLFKLTAVA